jgi:hypothetical protein
MQTETSGKNPVIGRKKNLPTQGGVNSVSRFLMKVLDQDFL